MANLFYNLENILRQTSQKLITQKTQGIKDLYDILNGEDAKSSITDNSISKEYPSVTWNSLLIHCHQLLIECSQRARAKATKAPIQMRDLCCSIMALIIKSASSSKRVYLTFANLMEVILEILTNKAYQECHAVYVQSLSNDVLSNRLYRVQMTPHDWQNLLKSCVKLYKSFNSVKSLLIYAIQKIIEYGCLKCNLYQNVKLLLPLLDKLFEDISSDTSDLAESACKLAVTVVQQIGTENRRSLCELTEKIQTILGRLKGTNDKYEFLYYVILLHHPNGATMDEDTFYAHDRDHWKRSVVNIQSGIFRDLNPIQLSQSFIAVAVEILHQTISDSSFGSVDNNETDVDMPQRAKRRRLGLRIQSPLDLLSIEFSKNNLESRWPIFQILSHLLYKYPQILKSCDFTPLLKSTSEYFAVATKEPKIMDSLCQLGKNLIEIEKLFKRDSILSESTNKYWDQIFDNALITLGMGQNEVEGHKLLQTLIEYRGVQNVNAFVNLYFTNAIKWSIPSVQTLLVLCSNVLILDEVETNSSRSEESDRKRVIRWCLNVPGSKILNPEIVDDICRMITGLILKTWDRRFSKNRFLYSDYDFSENDDEILKCIENMKKCHLSLDFRVDLFDKKTQKNQEKVETVLKPSISDENLNLVIEIITKMMEIPAETSDDISVYIFRLAIIAKCLSNFLELEIENCNKLNEVIETFTLYIIELCDLFEHKNTLKPTNHKMTIQILRSLATLYSNKYHHKIGKIIVDNATRYMLRTLFEMLNVEEESDPHNFKNMGIKYYENIFELWMSLRFAQKDSLFGNKRIEDHSVIISGTHQVLTAYCLMDTGTLITERQAKVLKNLLKAEIYNATFLVNFWKSLALLKSILRCRIEIFPQEVLTEIGEFIVALFNIWKEDVDGVKGILELIPEFIEYFTRSQTDYQRLLEIPKSLGSQLNREYMGPSVQITFLNSVHKIMELKPILALQLLNSNDLFNYVCSDCYFVRLESLKILHFLFSSNDIDILGKKNLFDKVTEIVMDPDNNIFLVDGNLPETILEDEKVNRIVSALLVLGTVIHSSAIFQPQALNLMLKLQDQRIKDIELIKKILSAVLKYNNNDRIALIENNLYDLIKTRIREEVSIGDFWKLTRCSSEVDFYEAYIGIFILIKLEFGELDQIGILCRNLEYPFEKAIENNFPSIVSWILAEMSKLLNQELHNYIENVYERLRANSDEFTNVKIFSLLLDEKLSDVLLDLIQRLHDRDNFKEMFEVNVYFPKMAVPNFKQRNIAEALEKLKNSVTENSRDSFVKFLVVKRPHIVQKILSTLIRNIHTQTILEYKLKVFHHYAYFCHLLISEISEEYFNEMSTFVIRDISYTLINFIEESDGLFFDILSTFLHQFLQKILPSRNSEVSGILNHLVTSLISIIQSGKKEKPLNILKLLIVDGNDCLEESIKHLDAFPNSQSFDEIRAVYNSLKQTKNTTWTLRDEMEHFLNVGQEKTLSCSIEGLVHLRKELSEHREDLRKMYNDLDKLRGFAEDCASSTLHRLIYRLIKLTESSNMSIALEAARCLGELGPTDLTTMILHPEEGHLQEEDDAIGMLTQKVISQLSDYLIESNLTLREASAEALYHVYASYWGQKIIKQYQRHLGGDHFGDKLLMILKNTRPFLTSSSSRSYTVELDKRNCSDCLDPGNDIWKGERIDSYTVWIKNLTCTILNCFAGFYATSLIPVCRLNTEFCEIILPRLIYLIINTDEGSLDNVCTCINEFFANYFRAASSMEQSISNGSQRIQSFSHQSVKCMLNIVNFIRIQSGDNFQGKFNYLHISKAAQYCSAYFTSLLYAELSYETSKKTLGRIPNNISIIDHLCEKKIDEGKSLQEILREAYMKIGDPDAIHGCGLSHLREQSSRIQHYIQFGKWDKVMTAQDVELSTGFSCSRGMINALQHTGLDYLLSKFLTTIKKDENIEDCTHEMAWRLADWSILTRHQTSDNHNIMNNDYEYYHYQSLKCLHDTDNSGSRSAVENARISIIKSLRNTSLECSQTIYPKLLKLQMLREVEELNDKRIEDWIDVISEWKQQDLSNINDFPYIEPILSQRIVMLKIKHQFNNNVDMKNLLVETYLELSRVAQQQGHLHIAHRALESLGRTADLSEEMKDRLHYHEALLAWARGDQDIARFLLRDLINKRDLNPRLLSQGLKFWGNWMAENKSETPQVIKSYYEQSIGIINSIDNRRFEDLKNLNDTHAALAQFADAQYQYTTEFMKTPLFESLKETAKFVREGASLQSKSFTNDKQIRSAMIKNERTDTNDIAEYEKIQSEQNMYLNLAIEYYCVTLIDGDSNNFLIFRLVSLWFKNMEHEELNKILNQYLNDIASYKFIPLIPQLAPHISTERKAFAQKINNLVRRCASEHPHHVLPVLLALCNTNKDDEYLKRKPKDPPVRVLAARKIIDELSKTNIRRIIEEMTKTAEALMMLAYHKFDGKKPEHKIPGTQQILRIQNFNHCMVPTINLDVRPDGNYQNIVGIYKFKDTFESLGGVNAPKKIVCVGSDGVHRIQVIKVDPDIKTDSIMQQVFTVMNSLFQSSKETKRRKLNIRTYKVVSLSQQSGVLQWCDNTSPMSTILLGDKRKDIGLHAKYHKNDWNASQCRDLIAKNADKSNEIRLKAYMKCCENFRPAFQYFFLEKFPSPETWFERRMAYVRSVATTSMVGYILGLGDRHFSNILIDQTTAEVVHIDFGIAFEQGKVLPIPEPIPFRLTRDMEVAMGVSGVEGVMRRCCEETMTVLRDRREMIITLLQVLIYDPLFSWSISPYKACKMQSEDSSRFSESSQQDVKTTNKMAERALLRIEQKLQGTEEGITTSISGQVERLIQQARDPANLSRLYHGWQAYL